MRLITRVMVSSACATAALIGGSGIASAEPNADAIYNSTCTYPQVLAALNAQDPAAANQAHEQSHGSGLAAVVRRVESGWSS